MSIEDTQTVDSHTDESISPTLTDRQSKIEAAIRLLDSWSEGDEQEQRETWEYLQRSLDEDRLSYRKLFP